MEMNGLLPLCEEIINMKLSFTLNLKYFFSEVQNRLVHSILLFEDLNILSSK